MREFACGLKDTTTSLDFTVKYESLVAYGCSSGERGRGCCRLLVLSEWVGWWAVLLAGRVGASGRTPFCAQLQPQVGVSRYQPGKLEGGAWRDCHGSSLLSAQVSDCSCSQVANWIRSSTSLQPTENVLWAASLQRGVSAFLAACSYAHVWAVQDLGLQGPFKKGSLQRLVL